MIEPALALVEFTSIAAGIQAADAMVKRAPIDVIKAGTVHNGKYLVLIGGLTADVEESLAAGRQVGADGHLESEDLLPVLVEEEGVGLPGALGDEEHAIADSARANPASQIRMGSPCLWRVVLGKRNSRD